MKSDNPHSGFYEAGTSRTLDGNGGNPSCNQGGIAVVEGNGSRPSHQGDGYKESDVMYTLNATEQHGVAYGIDRATYNMGQNAQFDIAIREEVEPTIVAKGTGRRGASGILHQQKLLSYGGRRKSCKYAGGYRLQRPALHFGRPVLHRPQADAD